MSAPYEEEFKKKLVYLHIGEGRSIKSFAKEYNISHSTISIWCKNFKNECKTNPQAQESYNYQKEILKLNTHLAEVQKENDFKKNAKILGTGDKRVICGFIKSNHKKYGLNWLLNKCKISYYNFKKNRKEESIKNV